MGISYKRLAPPNYAYLSPQVKIQLTKHVAIVQGFPTKPDDAKFVEELSNSIENETKRKSLVFLYNHETGGPKRSPNGGIDSEFIKLDKSSHAKIIKNNRCKKEIGGFNFKWNQYTDFFNDANFLLHKAISRQIVASSKDEKVLVLDSMCGIGPMVLPFLKKTKDMKNFKILANDWNPSAIKSLKRNISYNGLDLPDESIFCEDAKSFLIRETQSTNFDKIWIVMGGTPGVTEQIFLPLFIDGTIKNKNNIPIILTITGKKMEYIYDWINKNNDSKKILQNVPLKPIWIRNGSVTAQTLTFL